MALEAPDDPGRAPIVYIVEDDEAVRDALAVLLGSAGYTVAAHASADSFLDAYQPGCPGCLLVNLDLPEMDGLQLVGMLVACRIKLPAVLMNGRIRKLRLRSDPPPGIVGILDKPFGDHELLQRIEFALGRPHTH
jgi:FixJ family two-component response regulator